MADTMIDKELLWKYVDKYDRYARAASESAESLREYANDGNTDALENCAWNMGESEAYMHVVRDLRALIEGIR